MFSAHAIDLGLLPPLSFALQAGECLAVMGPSGSGKTLLLRALADLDPRPGRVLLRGVERGEIQAPKWRAQVRFSAAEAAWWAERVAQHFVDPEAARGRLITLGLKPELMDRLVARLSTGERQRLGLLRALEDGAPVLLLDEPTASLDVASVAQVEALLLELKSQGKVLVLVTHTRAQAQRLGSHLLDLGADSPTVELL